jgi:hypothetical protein
MSRPGLLRPAAFAGLVLFQSLAHSQSNETSTAQSAPAFVARAKDCDCSEKWGHGASAYAPVYPKGEVQERVALLAQRVELLEKKIRVLEAENDRLRRALPTPGPSSVPKGELR